MKEFTQWYQQHWQEISTPYLPEWLQTIKSRGFDNFFVKGFPTRKEENWKYSDTSVIAKNLFQPIANSKLDSDLILQPNISKPNTISLVFIDGSYSVKHSSVPQLPEGVQIISLQTAIEQLPELVKPYLQNFNVKQEQRFLSLNTAFMNDGLVVYIPKNIQLTTPIHLLFLTTVRDKSLMISPRNLIILEANTKASLLEEHLSLNASNYFKNTVTQIHVHDNANLDYYKLQNESTQAFHIGSTQIIQQRNSQVTSFHFAVGSQFARDDINFMLTEPGAECKLYGLYLASIKQHLDYHTRVDHQAKQTNSLEYYKGIIGEDATGVFNGKVVVHPHTQNINAQQSNKNLLLATTATVDTKPELEIYANDVKCTHGATVGQIDEDALFYLQARGIEKATAKKLLTQGFAHEILQKLAQPILSKHIRPIIETALQQINV